MSPGKADGVSSDDDCGVVVFVAAEDEGEGRWLVDAKIDESGGESNDGTAPLKGPSLGSPFRGTEKVNEVFLKETFSSRRRFRSSFKCRFSVSAVIFLASSSATLSSSWREITA
jgi:hypothetical protein